MEFVYVIFWSNQLVTPNITDDCSVSILETALLELHFHINAVCPIAQNPGAGQDAQVECVLAVRINSQKAKTKNCKKFFHGLLE